MNLARIAALSLLAVVTLSAQKLRIDSRMNLPDGRVGTAYLNEISVRGGNPPFSWSVTSGSLPPGIGLLNGILGGIPVTAGEYTFTILVTDGNDQDSQQFRVTILSSQPPAIQTTSLPTGTVGMSYGSNLSVSGGVAPYDWSISAGRLPTGIALNGSSGAISGTPTAAGDFDFTARVSDSANQTATKALRITILAAQPPPLTITTGNLPPGTSGQTYNASLSANGGTVPYTWAISSGTLPAGLSMSAAGSIGGTPSTAGSFDFTAQVTDSASRTATKSFRITINSPPVPPLSVSTGSLPPGTAGQAYNASLAVTGGTSPYSWAVLSGSPPTGLSLSQAGSITGTPTTTGNFDFTVQVTDSGSRTATKAFRITINSPPAPPLSVSTAGLPAGMAGQAYNASLAATGGTDPYSWAVLLGSPPTGLSLSAAGSITGTPTTTGNFDFTVQVTDSGNRTATKAFRITINAAAAPPLSVSTGSLPAGTAGQAYNASLAATGGTDPYSWAVLSGSPPTGLSLSAAGLITGTPTTTGNFDFTVQVTDSGSRTATKAFRITINAAPAPLLSVSTGSLPPGTAGQAYSVPVSATGGTPPYSWSVVAGTLPGGLGLSATGSIAGTPGAQGDFDFTAQVTDSASRTATKALRITINAAPPQPLSITSVNVPPGTVGQAYSATLGAAGGTPPYAWSVVSGALPSGLSLSAGSIAGTPTTAGDFDFTARVSDSGNQSASRQLRISIAAPQAPLTIVTSTLSGATAGADYNQTISGTGGRRPYSWTVSAGNLPPGLGFDSPTGRIGGVPTTPGTVQFTVRLTDADMRTAERSFAISVAGALSIGSCPAPSGILGSSYSSALTATGGLPPYLWSVTSGQAPPGVSLNAATGILSGAPILAGSFSFTLNISDSASRTAIRLCTITISGPLQLLTDAMPDATTRSAYNFAIRATGGTPPYRFTTSAGSLAPGLTLDEGTGLITGQPTLPGRFGFTVQVSDTGGGQAQGSFSISVATGLAIPSCPTPVASVDRPYSSTLTAIGGQSPYSWSLDGGVLPQGLQIDSASGAISGTPTNPGEVVFSIRAVDASQTSVSRSCSIQVAPALLISTTTLPGGEGGTPYTTSLAASGGSPPYSWTVSAGALAPGLTMNSATGQIAGTPTSAGTFRFTARVADSAGTQTEKQFEIAVGSGFNISACPSPSAIVGESYSSAMTLSGGEAPIQWALIEGTLPPGLGFNTQAGSIAGTPGEASSRDFVVRATDARSRSTSRACSISVLPSALRITGTDLPSAILGTAYEQSLQAIGGRSPYAWSFVEGSLPPGVEFNPTGSFAGTPSSVGLYEFTVRVQDAGGNASVRTLAMRVLPALAPSVAFGDLPEIMQPAQQPRIRLALGATYPTALKGKLSLRFTPDPGLNVDDPSVRFVTGDRTVEFDIPSGGTEAVFPVPQLVMQTGSVAGVIELGVSLSVGELDVTPSPTPVKTVRVDRTAPVITNVRINPSSTGFELIITGLSTTREVTSAMFQFTPAAGSRLESSQITIQTEVAARQWFADTRSTGFGGQFTFVQPFTVQNASLSEVSVTLTNGQGTSQAVRARF